MELPRLILIADRIAAADRPLADVVVSAAEGVEGRLIVQLRDRELSDATAVQILRAIQRRVPSETVLTINNRPAIAQALNLGLHLPGYADAPGNEFVVRGRSIHDNKEAARAVGEQADYTIVGTIFSTASHPGRAGAGLDHLRAMTEILDPIPAFAIGGITAANAAGCVESGAWGVAVRGAIMGAPDPGRVARDILAAVAGTLPA